jgi:hypothetical protein
MIRTTGVLRQLTFGSFMLSCTALASETRVDTLQNIAGIQDESDIFRYAGIAGRYSLALIELGTTTNSRAWGAAVAPVNDHWHLGAAINRHDWQSSYYTSDSSLSVQTRFMNVATSSSSSGASGIFAKGDRSVEFFGAMNLSAERSIGFRLSSAKERLKQTTTAPTAVSEQLADSLEASLGYSIQSAFLLDVGLTIGITDHFKYQGTNDGVDLKSSMQRIDARFISAPQGSGYFANGSLANRSAKATVTSANVGKSGKFADQVLGLGGGYVYSKSESAAKIFAGLNLFKTSSKGPTATRSDQAFSSSITTSTESVKIDAQWLEAALSGESKFYENIGAMFGTNYTVLGSFTEDDKINKTKIEAEISSPSEANLWSLGLFWATEHARVDATIAKTFLHNGPHFIAGNETSPMLGKIAATFNF